MCETKKGPRAKVPISIPTNISSPKCAECPFLVQAPPAWSPSSTVAGPEGAGAGGGSRGPDAKNGWSAAAKIVRASEAGSARPGGLRLPEEGCLPHAPHPLPLQA